MYISGSQKKRRKGNLSRKRMNKEKGLEGQNSVMPSDEPIAKSLEDSEETKSGKLRRRKHKQKNDNDTVQAAKLQRRAQYLLVKMKLEQNLIDAYSEEGWKGQRFTVQSAACRMFHKIMISFYVMEPVAVLSTKSVLIARLAQIDLFGENGGLGAGIGGVREASVLRYKEKRRTRLFSKKIRYQVRKVNADQRPRMKGRFVRTPDQVGASKDKKRSKTKAKNIS
ncbi:CHLOROPLAST IMPORT APPARATUS 2-like protein [Drosera capensis]